LTAFVCLIEVELHLGEAHDLKQKRKLVKSLKDQLRKRGVAVAETDHHDKWQRATLLCALVGDGEVSARADAVQRLIESRCPDGCSFQRDTLSLADLRD
jgi:uncharacterized protein YlxP (DUF503 family)